MLSSFHPIIIELSLFCAGISSILMGVFSVKRIQLWISIILIAGGYFFLTSFSEGEFFEKLWIHNTFTTLMKSASFIGFVLILTIFFPRIGHFSFKPDEFLGLSLLTLLGTNIMISANHAMVLYLGLEIHSLSIYALVAMYRGSLFASEAGVKYFILGSLASVLFLLGCSYLYGTTHSLYFHEIKEASIHAPHLSGAFILGSVLVLVAFLFKVGAFPFHQWMPDAYQGAALPVTVLLATVSKIAGIAILIRFVMDPFVTFFTRADTEFILMFVSGFSMLIGAILPLTQTSIKRLLGYSSIGHIGFILMGLLGSTTYGVGASIFYSFVYALSNILLLGTLALCAASFKTLDNDDLKIDDLSGLSKKCPEFAVMISVALLAMAGIPPVVGFFPKLILLQTTLQNGYFALSMIAVVSAIISVYYYLRIVKGMYMDEPSNPIASMHTKCTSPALWIISGMLLLGCYWPFMQHCFENAVLPALHF